jgi:hypothetical protein
MYVLGFLADLKGVFKFSASEIGSLNAGQQRFAYWVASVILFLPREINASANWRRRCEKVKTAFSHQKMPSWKFKDCFENQRQLIGNQLKLTNSIS